MTSPMKSHILILLVLMFILPAGCRRQYPGKLIGVKIYDYRGDYRDLVSLWTRMGINTAFMSDSLAKVDEFRKMLSKKGIKVFIIFPVFQDPEALKEDSSLFAITNRGTIARDDWVEFVCPSRSGFREGKIEKAVRLVRELDPDGISIDFIRSFVYWEMVYPEHDPGNMDIACFCDSCVYHFLVREQIDLPGTGMPAADKAAFILKHHAAAWDDYRTGMIATLVNDIVQRCKKVKPGLECVVHAVPWRNGDFNGAAIHVAAQDLRKIATSADYISPMCYSQMLKRDPAWISSVVADMDERAPGMILPCIQVYPWYIGRPFSAEDFRECLQEALKPPSLGVVFWSWPLFEKDSSRMEVARKMILNSDSEGRFFR